MQCNAMHAYIFAVIGAAGSVAFCSSVFSNDSRFGSIAHTKCKYMQCITFILLLLLKWLFCWGVQRCMMIKQPSWSHTKKKRIIVKMPHAENKMAK